jgi:hypothetical protein
MVSLPHSLPLSPSCCSHRPPSPHGWAGMPRAQPPTVSPAGAPFPGHSTLLQCSRCHSLPNRAYASTPSLPHLRIADSRSPGMSTLYTHPPVEPRVSPLVQPLSPPRVTPPPQRTACEAATLQPCPTPSISSSRPARPPPCLRPSLVRPRCPLMRPTSTSLPSPSTGCNCRHQPLPHAQFICLWRRRALLPARWPCVGQLLRRQRPLLQR